jgi:hypothetical protein
MDPVYVVGMTYAISAVAVVAITAIVYREPIHFRFNRRGFSFSSKKSEPRRKKIEPTLARGATGIQTGSFSVHRVPA